MARKKGQDNLRDILILVNGAIHPRQKDIVENQRKVIEYMVEKENKTATRQELEKLLSLEFSNKKEGTVEWKSNSSKFYRVLSPLFKKVIENYREELKYSLSDIRFTTWFDSLRRTGKEMFG